MFITLPDNTTDLWTRLDEAIKDLPEEDKDVFLLDLMKFCVQWQFAYLQAQQYDDLSEFLQEPMESASQPSPNDTAFSSEAWL